MVYHGQINVPSRLNVQMQTEQRTASLLWCWGWSTGTDWNTTGQLELGMVLYSCAADAELRPLWLNNFTLRPATSCVLCYKRFLLWHILLSIVVLLSLLFCSLRVFAELFRLMSELRFWPVVHWERNL